MFFDLHCHPSFKTVLYSEDPAKRERDGYDCWKDVNYLVDDVLPIDDLSILDSQSSLSQLRDGNVNLIVAPLYGLENGFARAGIIRKAARFSRHADLKFIDRVGREKIGYHDLMWGDFDHLMRSDKPEEDKDFKVLRSMSEFDSSKINILLAVEGGHNFYDTGQEMIDLDEALRRLKYFKSPNTERLLYITFTHLTRQEFCNHAYGMKLINDQRFAPNGDGITEPGKKFIRTALDNQFGQRILIDIKHMSLKARKQFYAMQAAEFPDAPIMATHMGMTGTSWDKKLVRRVKEAKKYDGYRVTYHKTSGALDTDFNPWSINLYDEDIEAIVGSGGLIGLSLDQRILGCTGSSPEYISKKEFTAAQFKEVDKPKNDRKIPATVSVRKERRHLRHLCNNLVHIAKVAGDKAWKHVCIGSDYDGLINAINGCKDSSEIKNLFSDMVDELPEIADSAGVPLNDVQGKLRDFLFNNGKDFLEKHFN